MASPSAGSHRRRSAPARVGTQFLVLRGKQRKGLHGIGHGQDRRIGSGCQHGLQQELGFCLRDDAIVSQGVQRHPDPAVREIVAIATLLQPRQHRLKIHHGLAKQRVLRPHGRPHHVAEGVHVLASLDAQADGIGKRLVDEALGNLAHGINDSRPGVTGDSRAAPPRRARRTAAGSPAPAVRAPWP